MLYTLCSCAWGRQFDRLRHFGSRTVVCETNHGLGDTSVRHAVASMYVNQDVRLDKRDPTASHLKRASQLPQCMDSLNNNQSLMLLLP